MLAVSTPAVSAQTRNELPLGDDLVGTEYRMTVTLPRGDLMTLIQMHKGKCEALGPSRCRVVRLETPDLRGYGGGSMKLVLMPGMASAFMADISKSIGNAGLTIDRDGERTGQGQADVELEKQLLQAQRDKLNSLADLASDEQLLAIQGKRSNIEANLSRLDEKLTRLKRASDADRIYMHYNAPDRNERSRLGRKLDDIWPVIVIGVLSVSAVALLTALYFGIIWLAFLWLRKIAIKRGLLKSG